MITDADGGHARSVFICGSLLEQLADESGEFATQALVHGGVDTQDGVATSAEEFD
jgi:hypothetical protein